MKRQNISHLNTAKQTQVHPTRMRKVRLQGRDGVRAAAIPPPPPPPLPGQGGGRRSLNMAVKLLSLSPVSPHVVAVFLA